MMLWSFGQVRATMLRLGMRTSSICFFKTSFVNMAESGAQFELCKNSKKSPRKTWTERETTDLVNILHVIYVRDDRRLGAINIR